MPRRLRIVLVASEAVPFAKTGGLADVSAALSRALARRGHEVHVVLPLYGQIDRNRHRIRPTGLKVQAWFPPGPEEVEVYTSDGGSDAPTTWLLDHPLFHREGLYGDRTGEFGDNHLRFALLCRGALDLCRRRFPSPDILHLHDWQAALAAVDLRAGTPGVDNTGFERTRVVFTIHNLAYMGAFDAERLDELGIPEGFFHPGALEFWGRVALLKGGLIFSDALTTVSPRYAREIQTPEFGYGLDGILRERASQLFGILNGIDADEWNPATDLHLPVTYDASNLAGKARCKAELQREMGVAPLERAPLFGVVARLAWQKGIDLVADVAERLVQARAQLVVLGTGEPELEARLQALSRHRRDQIGVRIGFDEGLAHRIEAGCDAFLMPSRYEPCGLNQIYSLRYGTVPVVRAVGGLDDTVEELDSQRGSGTGFKFGAPTAQACWAAVERALDAFDRPAVWSGLVQRGMRQDYSWNASAAAYERLFLSLVEKGATAGRDPGLVVEAAPTS